MDDAQVAELRRWAVGLANDSRAEVKAAAKAILLLSDDLLAARSQQLEDRLIRGALEARDAADGRAEAASGTVAGDLLGRVRSLLHRRAPRLSG
jgi:hypothetical protein